MNGDRLDLLTNDDIIGNKANKWIEKLNERKPNETELAKNIVDKFLIGRDVCHVARTK
jgi:hypothetical protein